MAANPFIYFSGDSYMAGAELADDTLQCWKDIFGTYQEKPDPRYPEFILEKWKEVEHWTIQQNASFLQCVRDRHWTTIVCDKHGIKHHNDGVGGSSQEAVLHRAVISFDKFERAGNVPTLAIIQLTSPGRVTVYKDVDDWRGADLLNLTPHRMFDMSMVLNWVYPNNPGAKTSNPYRLAHMDVESETGNIVRWLTALAITNSFFKEKTGRYPIYLSSLAPHIKNYTSPMEDFFANNTAKTTETTGYASLLHQARLHTVNPDIWNLGHDRHLTCPGGHHTPQTHANFAQFIEPHVLQELNNGS